LISAFICVAHPNKNGRDSSRICGGELCKQCPLVRERPSHVAIVMPDQENISVRIILQPIDHANKGIEAARKQ
jgi:hypothetical protein